MPHRRPKDYPGAWWHLTNRGIAKRTAFENRQDVEVFLECLAKAVADGRIELHAYAVLTTHYHLLVRSFDGGLSAAMHDVVLTYVRWFNRSRKRDGSLFRGRYKARLIEDSTYWSNTLRYIDLNPVKARMCVRPSQYPFGSAYHYARAERPHWLTTSMVEGVAAEDLGPGVFRRDTYDEFSLSAAEDLVTTLVETGLEGISHARTVPLTDLVHSASRRQRRWFEWKAALADGTATGVVVVPAGVVDRVVARLPESVRDARDLHAALLRELAGLRLTEIAERLDCSVSTVHLGLRRHHLRCEEERGYRTTFERVVDLLVRRAWVWRAAAARRGG